MTQLATSPTVLPFASETKKLELLQRAYPAREYKILQGLVIVQAHANEEGKNRGGEEDEETVKWVGLNLFLFGINEQFAPAPEPGSNDALLQAPMYMAEITNHLSFPTSFYQGLAYLKQRKLITTEDETSSAWLTNDGLQLVLGVVRRR